MSMFKHTGDESSKLSKEVRKLQKSFNFILLSIIIVIIFLVLFFAQTIGRLRSEFAQNPSSLGVSPNSIVLCTTV